MEPQFLFNMISAGESTAEASSPLKPSSPQLHGSPQIIWYLLVHIWLRDPKCEALPQQNPELSVFSSKKNPKKPKVLGFVPVSWRKTRILAWELLKRNTHNAGQEFVRCFHFALVGVFGGIPNPDLRRWQSSGHFCALWGPQAPEDEDEGWSSLRMDPLSHPC